MFMVNYTIPPFSDFACKEPHYAYRSMSFDENEINKIIEIGEYGLRLENARIGGGVVEDNIRNCKVSWFPLDNNTTFIYDRIAHISRELNGMSFQMDISGFFEPIQYTVYESSSSENVESGHYTWHIDKGFIPGAAPRKMSIVIQLSDPSEYEGGNLEIFTGSEPERLNKAKGLMYAFPSYTLHRVTPVTSGVRRTLVAWLTGPKFR